MIRKLKESNNSFNVKELTEYIKDIAEETLNQLGDVEFNCQEVSYNVPGYDPDWCSEDFTHEDEVNKRAAINAITKYIQSSLMRNKLD